MPVPLLLPAAIIIAGLVKGGVDIWAQGQANKETDRARRESIQLGKEQVAEDRFLGERQFALQSAAQRFNKETAIYQMKQGEQQQVIEAGLGWLNQNQSLLKSIVDKRRR